MSIGKTVAFQRADRFLAEPAQAAGAPALVVIVGVAVMALGSNKLGERGGRLLKLLSGAVMLALGVVLLLRPQWLLLDCCAGRCSLARFVGSGIDLH